MKRGEHTGLMTTGGTDKFLFVGTFDRETLYNRVRSNRDQHAQKRTCVCHPPPMPTFGRADG